MGRAAMLRVPPAPSTLIISIARRSNERKRSRPPAVRVQKVKEKDGKNFLNRARAGFIFWVLNLTAIYLNLQHAVVAKLAAFADNLAVNQSKGY